MYEFVRAIDINGLISRLCKKRSILLVDLSRDPDYYRRFNMPADDFVERSFTCGNTIILGVYSDPGRRLFSFFHELGHRRGGSVFWRLGKHANNEEYNNLYDEERLKWGFHPFCIFWHEVLAWRYAIKFSRRLGFDFSNYFEWARQELLTYLNGGDQQQHYPLSDGEINHCLKVSLLGVNHV
jgi:hypothetical protein